MLPKNAMVEESVEQMDFANVIVDFTWRIVQVSLRKLFSFLSKFSLTSFPPRYLPSSVKMQ